MHLVANLVGHSHINALAVALHNRAARGVHSSGSAIEFNVVPVAQVGIGLADVLQHIDGAHSLHPRIVERLENKEVTAHFSLLGGNTHNIMGLLEHPTPYDFVLSEPGAPPPVPTAELLTEAFVYEALKERCLLHVYQLQALQAHATGPVFHLESPPPIGDDAFVLRHLDEYFTEQQSGRAVAPRGLRYKLWRLHSRVMREACAASGVVFLPAPPVTLDAEGFLRPEGYARNATHANGWYGEHVLRQIELAFEALVGARSSGEAVAGAVADQLDLQAPAQAERARASEPHPYSSLPAHRHWRHAVSSTAPGDVDPVLDFPFTLTRSDKVATAGSCFAQHLARHLSKAGLNYYVAESGHPVAPKATRERLQYGLFSARYGNVYTSRQLLQLFDRAHGTLEPQEHVWTDPAGRFYDAFRPTVEPSGFGSVGELEQDRTRHLGAVRGMFRDLDYFVFTLGLTECWSSTSDGVVFPLCPGVVAGRFDPAKHRLLNLTVNDVLDDMNAFVERLGSVNPRARIILTVSPVPLMATAEPRHVLTATTYSKSVLRVACEMQTKSHPNVAYFPSYEIITGSFSRGAYFADDLRSVKEEGVQHVMRLFLRHATEQHDGATAPGGATARAVSAQEREAEAFMNKMEEVVEVICDEERLGSG